MDKDGSAILNWYGAQETYEYIPMYKLIQAAEGKHFMSDINLKGKVVYFGTTASSLFDIKTVPSSKVIPGVEIQATYINNIIDNNFIRRLDRSFTIFLGVLLSLITICIVMNEASAFVG